LRVLKWPRGFERPIFKKKIFDLTINSRSCCFCPLLFFNVLVSTGEELCLYICVPKASNMYKHTHNIHMCVYVCMYTYVHADCCLYMSVSAVSNMYINTHNIHVYVRMYVYTCTLCTSIYTCMYVFMYIMHICR